MCRTNILALLQTRILAQTLPKINIKKKLQNDARNLIMYVNVTERENKWGKEVIPSL